MGVTCLLDDGKEPSREGKSDGAEERREFKGSITEWTREIRSSGTWKSVSTTRSTDVFLYLHLGTTLTHFVESLLKGFKITSFQLDDFYVSRRFALQKWQIG